VLTDCERTRDFSTTTAEASLLLDWLSIWPDGVGIVWTTGKSDRKPRIDNSLHDLFHYRWTFCIGCFAVVPDYSFLLRQFLQRFPQRLYRGRCSVDGDAPIRHYSYFQDGLRWLLLSKRDRHWSEEQGNSENRSQHGTITWKQGDKAAAIHCQ